jgi:hypothetical protein
LPAVGRFRQAQTTGLGLVVLCFGGLGSVPSDPRLSFNIGKPGIRQRRKSTKTGEDASIPAKADNRLTSLPTFGVANGKNVQ